ncbi:hypothetical protein ALC56_11790 [Trachymyrmex septentrionalis]|uniref:CHK kinase-like domain-containing protein n=1 Tax=Trachymyrmex septentrionalis TaxID=34720 RepID=A0A195F0T5_9HYME|nr:PREDICTED: uncharacterized protein LOC108753206 [Trachymyrmex septentrionalis]KYN33976.1 hypothetical protein ALC56_11790 [Trachymyrmex septentrionalis]
MSYENVQRWIDEMMPKIIENLGSDIHKAQYELLESTGNFIMSNIYRVRLKFENKTNKQNEELSIILKRPMLGFSQIARIDLQFRNEILFYQMYTRPDNYAKCFYVEERPPIDSIIALENVNEQGYYSWPYRYDPPVEYTLAAMRELGRFHGKGYVMKEMQREKFFNIAAQIQEVRYTNKTENIYKFACNIKTSRVVEYLRSQDHDAVFCDKMEALLSNAFEEVMIKTVQPLEPLATLCHGDFTLDNILFKTEDDNGQHLPILIDFALIRYSTPVIDLSTYLHLCCSNEIRKEKFFDFIQAYHDSLKEYLLNTGVQDIEKYSYNALLSDFKRGALFGFVVMCVFIPIILGYLSPEVLVQEILDFGPLESMKKQRYAGGDKVSKILVDALLYLKDLGCLKHVL